MDNPQISEIPRRANVSVLHLFRGPYITLDNDRKDVPEGSKRLLAFLALHRGRAERRQVAGTLWPLGDDDRAAGNLRSALWRLRVAGIDLLVTNKWSVRLSEDVDVDVHLVEEWAARLINGIGRDDDLAVSPSCLDALNLLPGWYDDWALMERERLRQRMLHALEALSRHLVKASRFADAVDAAILAVNAEPLRESAQRTLIQAHIAEGNLVEARRAYCSFRKLVRTELGVEPSSELLTLLRAAQVELSRNTSSAMTPPQFPPADGLERWSATATRRLTSVETSAVP